MVGCLYVVCESMSNARFEAARLVLFVLAIDVSIARRVLKEHVTLVLVC